ncbi:MAG: ATP-binding protein [Lachnospiraceae bacterium]
MLNCFYVLNQFVGFLIQVMPIIFLVYTPYEDSQLKMRKREIISIAIVFAVVVFGCTSLMLGTMYSEEDRAYALLLGNVVFVLFGATGTLLYFLSQKKENAGRMLSYIISLQYAVIVYTIVQLGVKIIENVPFGKHWTPYSSNGIVLYAVVTAVTYPVIRYFLKKYSFGKLKRISKNNLYIISGCSLALFFIYIIALVTEMTYSVQGTMTANEIIWMVCLILTDILAYVMYFICINVEDKNSEMQIQFAATELQYKALCGKIQEEQRLRHNTRHHFRILVTLMENQEYAEMEKYLRTYLDDWEQYSGQNISRNPVINHVLEYYFKEARQQGVRVAYEIELKEHYPFSISDMTVLLGNMMENALEACLEYGREDSEIHLMIRQYKKSILIEETNPCTEADIARSKKGPLSSKKDRAEGYGITSMKMIVEKYRGNMEYWKDGNQFTIRMVLNIPQEKTGSGAGDMV